MLHPGVVMGRLMPYLAVEYFGLGMAIGIVRAFRLNWTGPITRATFKSRAHGPLFSLSPALIACCLPEFVVVSLSVVVLVVDLLERFTPVELLSLVLH